MIVLTVCTYPRPCYQCPESKWTYTTMIITGQQSKTYSHIEIDGKIHITLKEKASKASKDAPWSHIQNSWLLWRPFQARDRTQCPWNTCRSSPAIRCRKYSYSFIHPPRHLIHLSILRKQDSGSISIQSRTLKHFPVIRASWLIKI